MRGRGHTMKGIVKDFELIPKDTENPLKRSKIVIFSFFIRHSMYDTGIVKKAQEEMWGDQVKGHFSSGLRRKDGSLAWD